MKRFFHTELVEFRSNLLLMGERAIEIVRMATDALLDSDAELAERALAQDDELDRLEIRIDNEGIRYISLRAPVATELRLVTIGMRAGHELERVGDEASTVAKRVKRLALRPAPASFHHLPKIVTLTLGMLRDSIDCLVDEDFSKAREVPPRDLEVDRLNRENYRELAALMTAQPTAVETCLDLIFISKALERIGDHATNLAEDAIFLYRGEDLRHTPDLKRPGEPREGEGS